MTVSIYRRCTKTQDGKKHVDSPPAVWRRVQRYVGKLLLYPTTTNTQPKH